MAVFGESFDPGGQLELECGFSERCGLQFSAR
jgi:hypothetical protein